MLVWLNAPGTPVFDLKILTAIHRQYRGFEGMVYVTGGSVTVPLKTVPSLHRMLGNPALLCELGQRASWLDVSPGYARYSFRDIRRGAGIAMGGVFRVLGSTGFEVCGLDLDPMSND